MNCFVFAHAMVSHKENSMRPNSFERERERKRVGKSLVSRRGLFSLHANAYSAKTKKKRGARLLLFFFFGRHVVVVFVVDTRTLVRKETPRERLESTTKDWEMPFPIVQQQHTKVETHLPSLSAPPQKTTTTTLFFCRRRFWKKNHHHHLRLRGLLLPSLSRRKSSSSEKDKDSLGVVTYKRLSLSSHK